MQNFYEKLNFAVKSGLVSTEDAKKLAKQHQQEIAAWKEAKKFARPRDGYSRVTKKFQWH